MARDEQPRRKVLGLDRARLVDAAAETAVIMCLVLLVSDELGDRIELWMIATLVSLFILFTLANYGLHAATRDWLRDDSKWPGKRKRDQS